MREETHIDGTSTGSCKAGEGNYCTVCSLVRKCTKLYYFTFSSHVRCKKFLDYILVVGSLHTKQINEKYFT